MTPPFPTNPFESHVPADRLASIVSGVKENLHFAFSFAPGGGGDGFSRALGAHLQGEPVTLLYLDLAVTPGAAYLAKQISRAAVAAFAGDIKKIEATLKKLIPTATAKIVMGKADRPYIDFEFGADINRLLGNLFDVPEIIGMDEDRPTVVIWNRFDRLEKIIGKTGMELFFAKGQRHAITSHAMIGHDIARSTMGLEGSMKNQVQQRSSEDVLSKEELLAYFAEGFGKAGIAVNERTVTEMLERVDGRTELAVTLCAAALHLQAIRKNGLTSDLLDEAVNAVTTGADAAYRTLWEMLNNRQKSLLAGICRDPDLPIYSEPFITQYDFGTATNLQAALRSLTKKDVLTKQDKRWAFADPFFREWIVRAFRSAG